MRRRRPWLVLSVGVLAAVGLGLARGHRRQPPPPPAQPLLPGHDLTGLEVGVPVVPPLAKGDVGMPPEPAWAIKRAAELGLSDQQVEHFRQFQTAFEQATAEDRKAHEKASADFMAFLKSQEASGQIDNKEAERRNQAAKPVGDRIAAQRKVAWEKCWAELDEGQRDKVLARRGENPFELR